MAGSSNIREYPKHSRRTRVLMFGWEFPPHSSGGLGTACQGLTKGLKNKGVDVIFVVPKGDFSQSDKAANSHVKLKVASEFLDYADPETVTLKTRYVDSPLTPYMTSSAYSRKNEIYGKNLYEEVERLAHIATRIAEEEEFDVIHCHDWMTYKAGINAKKISKKPLIVHVHATEFDRSGGNINKHVYSIERKGLHEADRVICVSNFTKNIVVKHYGIPSEKVMVVHNAIEHPEQPERKEYFPIRKHHKIVLFLGRLTLQKGPDYFVEAAKKVSDKMANVRFVVVGTGDMEGRMIERSAELGLGSRILFSGFMSGKDIDRAYRMADVYVMPSVSEPFGLTALEAMRNGTPCIISKQSGVSEVVKHCLKVDFWDVNELANKIMCALKYHHLHGTLRENGLREVKKFNWDNSAGKCVEVYASANTHHQNASAHAHHQKIRGGCS